MTSEISSQQAVRRKSLLLAAIFFVVGLGPLVGSFYMPGPEIHGLAEFNNGMWDRLTSFSTPHDWVIAVAVLLHTLAFICFIAGTAPIKK